MRLLIHDLVSMFDLDCHVSRNMTIVVVACMLTPLLPVKATTMKDNTGNVGAAVSAELNPQPAAVVAMSKIPGSVHPATRTAADLGAVKPGMRMESLSLNVGLSAAQQAEASALLQAQQDPQSPQYHRWLTQAEYGARFGLTEADLGKLTDWLETHGFTVKGVAPSRNLITFAGTVSQVQSAFQTEIHQYRLSDGSVHIANATEISIPKTLAGLVIDVRGLNSFRPRPHLVKRTKPEFTSYTSGDHYLAPSDWAKIYNVNPLYSAGFTGSGMHVGVAGQTYLPPEDIKDFRTAAGLGAPLLNMVCISTGVSCTDTSAEGVEDIFESDLDVEWSGAIAKNATVDFLYAARDDQNLSVFDALVYGITTYTVSGAVLPVIGVSYGDCESDIATNYQSVMNYLNNYLQEAATQGQTIMIASGDDGAGCTITPPYQNADRGTNLSWPASSPFVVAVGGTEFSADGTASNPIIGADPPYWSYSGTADLLSSALGYIPETSWNDTAFDQSAAAASGDPTRWRLAATSGGVSSIYAMPNWQSAPSGISGSGRLVPDVSFTASADHDGYLFCTQHFITIDPSSTTGPTCLNNSFRYSDNSLSVIGGTSASAQVFSGMMTLLVQALGPQGNINPRLYGLAAKPMSYANVFHDVTTGNNIVPCTACSGGEGGYSARTGYDLATGLGSIDAYQLYLAMRSLQATTTAVTATPNSVMSSGTTTLTATVASTNSGTVTGAVTFSVSNPTQSTSSKTLGTVALSNGTAALSNVPVTVANGFTVGPDTVTASFGGNASFAPSSGGTTLQVTPIPTTTTLTATPSSVTIGEATTLTVAVKPATSGTITGTVIFSVISPSLLTGSKTLGTATVSNGMATLSNLVVGATNGFSTGTETITANFSGDLSFAASNGSTTLAVLPSGVQPTSASPSFGSVAVGQSGPTVSVQFRFSSPITLGSTAVLTTGARNKDFQAATGGTCKAGSYSRGSSCTVNVSFKPLAPGVRNGAIVLYDTATPPDPVATAYISGIGTGPAIAFEPGIISTIAGNGYELNGTGGYTGDGGPATSAELNQPSGVAVDGEGNLYIADSQNNVVRKVNAATGIITTVAGGGYCILSPIFPIPIPCFAGDGGPALGAETQEPTGVALDGAGNLYLIDFLNQRIRKVDGSTGIISTVAGNGSCDVSVISQGVSFCYSGDGGPATDAELSNSGGITVDNAGNLYIVDTYRVRKVDAVTGIISTVAGNGSCAIQDASGRCFSGDGGPATSAELSPGSVAVDGAGNLYIGDHVSLSARIRKVDAKTGIITTVAGNGSCAIQDSSESCFSGDGGPATSAELTSASGIAVDGAGNLYIADTWDFRIRMVNAATGVITTVAGGGGCGISNPIFTGYCHGGDGGPATSAELDPVSIAVDGKGALYIADLYNNLIRKVDVSDPPSLTFNTYKGAVSPAQDLTVENIGNAQLDIAKIGTTGNFALGGADTSCVTNGQPLASAASCILGIEFVPKSTGSNSGSVVLTDNTLNTNRATQTIALNVVTGLIQQTIAFPPPGGNLIYGTVTSITLNATATSRLPVSYTLISGPATLKGSTLTITGAGTITVQATQAGDSIHAPASAVSLSFDVSPAWLTVAAFNAHAFFGSPIPALSGSLTGVVGGDGITASYTTTAVQGSPAGNYPINANLNDPNNRLSNYEILSNTPGTLIITNPSVAIPTQKPVSFGSVNLGQSSATYSVGFTFEAGVQLGNSAVLTQGASGKDFQAVAGSTCTPGGYSSGSSCVVNVTFHPLMPGGRYGAVVLYDTATPPNLLATAYISGIGVGPAIAFGPGIISTIAGNGCEAHLGGGCFGGDGGPASGGELYTPTGVALDGSGNLYIADTHHQRVRVVNAATNIITTFAGGGTGCPAQTDTVGDGCPATSAALSPRGVAVDGAGNLYIVDYDRLRMVNSTTGVITTVAGIGNCDTSPSLCFSGDGGLATTAELYPMGVAVDGAGNLYITGSNRIRKVDATTGIITTLAGGGTGCSAQTDTVGDGCPATSAALNGPTSLTLDVVGNLYIADEGNSRVREVDAATGVITTLAGNGTRGSSGDGGPATSAELTLGHNGGVENGPIPSGIAVDNVGNVYISDSGSSRIRMVNRATGTINSVAGGGTGCSAATDTVGDGCLANSAQLVVPSGLATDAAGNLYIADAIGYRIRKIDVSDAPSFSFSSTDTGSVSTAQDVAVENLGNAQLSISQISTAANFTLGGPDTSCAANNQALAPAASCILGIEFAPQSAGSIAGSVVLTDNTLGVVGTTQQIQLTGTAQAGSKISTTTTLTASATSTLSGTSVTFSATVTPSSGGAVPTGSVTFLDGFTTLGTASLDSTGKATYSTSSLSTGTHSISATYTGDTNDAVSTSSTLTVKVQFLAPSNVALASSANPSLINQPVTFTATVSSTSSGTPTGTVTFSDGATTLAIDAPLSNGSVSYTTSSLGVGAHSITATYSGDTKHAGNTSSAVSQVVNQVTTTTTTTTLTASATTLAVSTLVTFTAKVTRNNGVSGIPTGAVTFKDGTTLLGATSLDSTGKATYSTSGLSIGSHSITAVYGGDTNDATSVSSTLTITVQAAASKVTLTSSENPSKFHQWVTFTATVTSGLRKSQTGKVTFFDGRTILGHDGVNAHGEAVYTTSRLSIGMHSITASYDGDGNDAGGTSPVLWQVVKSGHDDLHGPDH